MSGVYMLAAYREKYCPPQNLQVIDIADPVPSEGEILVRVHATTVNRTDCAVLTAKPFIMRFFTGLCKPKLPVPGTDFAGEVVALGAGVRAFKTGDRVFGFRDTGLASQAQLMSIREDAPLAIIPEGTSYADAAASLEAAHYAYNFLKRVKLSPGMPVLVNGASGAIGSAMVQMLRQKQVTITAVCNGKNIERVRALGADRVINYEKEDFTLLGEKFEVIFDAVGKSTFAKCRHLLKPKGCYQSSEPGPGGQNFFLPLLTAPWGGRRVIFPIPSGIRGGIAFISGMLKAGTFKPLVDRTYPLVQIGEAYRYVMTGQKTGNVLVSMD